MCRSRGVHVRTTARVQERKYGHVCVHTGGVSNAYSRIRTARARVHGWVGTEKQRHPCVHGEPIGWVGTECVVVFIGRACMEQSMETRPGVPKNGANNLVFERPCSKWDPVHREGSGVPQNEGNGPPTVETAVLLIGRGATYRKTEETDLCWSTTVETGVLFIGRCVAYRHGILFISTIDLLQPPRAPVNPASMGSCSTNLHRALLH